MAELRKVKMKIGDAEFEAEVPADSVQAMYDQFLGALQNRGQKGTASAPAPKVENGANEQQRQPLLGGLDEAVIARIFELRQDGIVALKVLPKGDDKDANALLLILYGYRRLKQEEDVLATQLLRAAEQSGIAIYRPAHALSGHERYIIRGGQRKGSTYALNNQGMAKAEEVATKIFE
jgi:hypothetical protein